MPMSARIILTAIVLMCSSWVLAASCEDTKWNDAAVTTAVFGVPEIYEESDAAILVPYGDERAFAEKSLLLLEDDDNWRRMSTQALERVKELTWERCARETEASLEKILGARSDGEAGG